MNPRNQSFGEMLEAKNAGEMRAVELRVRLPREVAAEAEDVQRRDPDMLSRILLYGLTRRAIFEHLRSRPDYGVEGRP